VAIANAKIWQLPVNPKPLRPDVEALLERVLEREEAAWPELVGVVHNFSSARCTRSRASADAAAEVALLVVERLRRDDFAPLRSYQSTAKRYPQSDFFSWLSVVVQRVYIDWLRAQPESIRRQRDGQRQMHTAQRVPLLGSEVSEDTTVETRAEILRVASVLARSDFSSDARRAIALWLAGFDSREIAERLDLPNETAARRLLHATRQKLRRAVHAPKSSEER